jgi:hypothetical protein
MLSFKSDPKVRKREKRKNMNIIQERKVSIPFSNLQALKEEFEESNSKKRNQLIREELKLKKFQEKLELEKFNENFERYKRSQYQIISELSTHGLLLHDLLMLIFMYSLDTSTLQSDLTNLLNSTNSTNVDNIMLVKKIMLELRFDYSNERPYINYDFFAAIFNCPSLSLITFILNHHYEKYPDDFKNILRKWILPIVIQKKNYQFTIEILELIHDRLKFKVNDNYQYLGHLNINECTGIECIFAISLSYHNEMICKWIMNKFPTTNWIKMIVLPFLSRNLAHIYFLCNREPLPPKQFIWSLVWLEKFCISISPSNEMSNEMKIIWKNAILDSDKFNKAYQIIDNV